MERIQLLARRTFQLLGDGVDAMLRLGKLGQLIVAQGAGALQEAADRGSLYHGTTAVAGVAPGTAVGTTAAFALANPADSGVDLVIHKVSVGYLSGTLGAGMIVACVGPSHATAVSGTAIVEVSGKNGGTGAKGKALTTATLPATPKVAAVLWHCGASDGTEKTMPLGVVIDLDGSIIIPPGASFSMQGIMGAGTTPKVVFGCTWEEVPRSS